MAEPLKGIYHESFLSEFGGRIDAVSADFDTAGFVAATLAEGWEELKLKERIRHIAVTLGNYLPSKYEDALNILFAIDEQCVGFPYLFFPDFVEVHGSAEEDWELSMKAIERFTSKSSAEFAVRSFLIRDPERMMQQMTEWAEHPNEHVRRLATEGCRPRLPWGQALPRFKQDPTPVLSILEKLKRDSSLYVRKSVANNLNDIAKDHPSIVLETAQRWKGVHPNTDWIIRHGCRTLIRKADPEVLALFGYANSNNIVPIAISASLSTSPTALTIGESCELIYGLHIREGEPVKIRIEYGIDFVKAGGRTSRKLFLLSDKTVPGGSQLRGTRTHRWADLSTRRHYKGDHHIALVVNGIEVASCHIELV